MRPVFDKIFVPRFFDFGFRLAVASSCSASMAKHYQQHSHKNFSATRQKREKFIYKDSTMGESTTKQNK
jgi:hypothetical protein